MFSILFIYFIGKYFYSLAEDHQKNKWLFAVLGVVTFYIGGGLILFALLLPCYFLFPDFVDNLSDRDAGFLCIPTGIAACYFLYYILRRRWATAETTVESLDEIGTPEER